MNRRLDGYTVTIGDLDLHSIGFSIDFRGLTVIQNQHPTAPVAHVDEMAASVHWRELLRSALVADFAIEALVLHVNRAHLGEERADECRCTSADGRTPCARCTRSKSTRPASATARSRTWTATRTSCSA
jgi:hypothetical protein